MNDTEERQARLEERLRDGFEKIGAAMQQGLTVDNWMDHWETLLREFERLDDELAAAVPEQVELELGVRREVAA